MLFVIVPPERRIINIPSFTLWLLPFIVTNSCPELYLLRKILVINTRFYMIVHPLSKIISWCITLIQLKIYLLINNCPKQHPCTIHLWTKAIIKMIEKSSSLNHFFIKSIDAEVIQLIRHFLVKTRNCLNEKIYWFHFRLNITKI